MAFMDYEPSHYEVDTLLVELGRGLIYLVDEEEGAELLEQVKGLRQRISLELGLEIPRIRIIDNFELEASEYCIKLKGVEAGKSVLKIKHYLCISPGIVTKIKGTKTIDPVFGFPSLWVNEDGKHIAKSAGYTVVDHPTIISTHLRKIIERNAADILGLQDTMNILHNMRKKYPTVVEEVTRECKGCREIVYIWKILQGLLRENVSIRNMTSILEVIAVFVPMTTDFRFLIEQAREALAKQICSQYADENRTIHVMTLDPALEQKIIDSKAQAPTGDIFSALEPAMHIVWIKALEKMVRACQKLNRYPVILCSFQARYLVRSSLEREFPEVAVLSVREIAVDFRVEAIGVIKPDMLKEIVSEESKTRESRTSEVCIDANDLYNIGVWYENGKGVKKDLNMAAYWWTMAAAQGNSNAKEKLKNIANS